MARNLNRKSSGATGADNVEGETSDSRPQAAAERRVLRSRYQAVKHQINDEKDDISSLDSEKFKYLISEVESLHELVQKPREQVADAEAILDITNTLVTSIRSQSNGGLTPADFVTCLLRNFGQQHSMGTGAGNTQNSIAWKDIGLAVSHIFRKGPGCCTMLGPMNTELKQRKAIAQRKRIRPGESARPEELSGTGEEERTDTDKNMSTMFDILRRKRRVKLEDLVVNRDSFAQTVENIFALSFLVKDGRAEITVAGKGCHIVSPRNAPAANAVVSGEVSYSHFVFRFDYRDWKLMRDSVQPGDELMPPRSQSNILSDSRAVSIPKELQAAAPTTPIRKFCRNRGLIIQEESVAEDTPDQKDIAARGTRILRGKRKIQ